MWMFIGQTLSDDHSCDDAIRRYNVWRVAHDLKPCSINTTSYCKSRQAVPEELPLSLMRETAQETCDQANAKWLWKGRVVKLVDGTTVTMPDSAENQSEYPQPKSQKPGIGFPMARLVLIFSLAVGVALEVAIGKYAGKLTGEANLLRTLLHTILRGEVLLGDRYYATYGMLASGWMNQYDVVARSHQKRKVDFRKGLKLGYLDQLVAYHKPGRPYWMTKEEHEQYPEFILVRHLRYEVTQPGFRTKQITVATTLLDPMTYTAEDIAELYRRRWEVELDIRSIKVHLRMKHLRCQSPSMVRKEIYIHLLAYNLARAMMVEAALIFDREPRGLSFRGAVQAINAFVSAVAAKGTNLEEQYQLMLCTIAGTTVGHRPNRIEPRELKRRPPTYKLMQVPRHAARKRAA